jgi:CspA family cold shock protein
MATGKVKWFNNAKGWGFVTSDMGVDAFVHYTDILTDAGFRSLKAGDHVQFDIMEGAKGAKAVNVRRM